MSLLLYAIVLMVVVSLFKVNPLLCVAVLGGYAYFKFRGHRRRAPPPAARAGPEVNAALLAACVALLNQSRAAEDRPRHPPLRAEVESQLEQDPLGGLFRD